LSDTAGDPPADAAALLAALKDLGQPDRAAAMAAYHKAPRRYLGVANPAIEALARPLRRTLPAPERVALARALWETDIHEARILAARLLTQARMRPDDGAWALIASWVESFDAWAIADHACIAGQKRLVADPARIDEVEGWTHRAHMWSRRAALVMTLPWARMNHPKARDLAVRERVLGWAAALLDDRDWFIHKVVASWLRDLSRRDAARVRRFLDAHGARMRPFARREAARRLG
jgi:3-methyladenine DNA glycosylase AlkD